MESLPRHWHKAAEWLPRLEPETRERRFRKWKKAVARSLEWVDDDDE